MATCANPKKRKSTTIVRDARGHFTSTKQIEAWEFDPVLGGGLADLPVVVDRGEVADPDPDPVCVALVGIGSTRAVCTSTCLYVVACPAQLHCHWRSLRAVAFAVGLGTHRDVAQVCVPELRQEAGTLVAFLLKLGAGAELEVFEVHLDARAESGMRVVSGGPGARAALWGLALRVAVLPGTV